MLLDAATVRMGMSRLRASEEGKIATLTDQERRILELIGEGYSNRQIADEMFLASARVEPKALQAAQFEFAHPQLEPALRRVLT